MEKAYRKLAPRVQIRGFRPGKAPRPLIEKQLGHHRLLDEAMDILLPEVYAQALKEQDITPAGQPTIEEFDEPRAAGLHGRRAAAARHRPRRLQGRSVSPRTP